MWTQRVKVHVAKVNEVGQSKRVSHCTASFSPVDVAVLFVGVSADPRRQADLIRQSSVLRNTVCQVVDRSLGHIDDLLN